MIGKYINEEYFHHLCACLPKYTRQNLLEFLNKKFAVALDKPEQ